MRLKRSESVQLEADLWFHLYQLGLTPGVRATEQGAAITRKGIQKYVGRVKEIGRTYKRHSNFYVGFYSQERVDFVDMCLNLVEELL